nr:retrovirus-related Pol polyprotein from transposon TNT 1-94 [Tanacetum cinerariifolium]
MEGRYASIAPKLEPRIFNRWKKRMLCYLTGMEPYYLKCIKDGSFQPKNVEEEFSNDEEEMTQVKVLMALADDELLVGKNDACNGEWIDINIRKKEVKESLFIPASLDYDHEMVLKSKDWVKRHNPNSKLPNFNTGRIIVLESQAVNECLNPIEAFNDPESTKDSESESLTPLALLRTL